MDTRLLTYGDTGVDELVQWLRSTGEPQDIAVVVRQYLEILRKRALEDNE